MRILLLAGVVALATAGGCAAQQVTPTFAMYSENQQALLVQVTNDKGDSEDCEDFWNLFRKSSSQVCRTRHRRSQHWVRVGDDHRVAAIPAEGAVDDRGVGHECVVDGEEVRCDDQRANALEDRVVVESGRRISACESVLRVADGYVCLGGSGVFPYQPGQFIYQPDGGVAVSTPAEAFAVAVDGKSATIVHHDAYGARVATVALEGGALRTIRERDFAFLGTSDSYHSVNTVIAVTPSGDHVMVRREHGCDVVEVDTARFTHEVSCGQFVGDVAYVIPGSDAQLLTLRTHARTALGDVRSIHIVDTGTMVARGSDRVVVIRRADAAIAAASVESLANRIVVSDRTIAAIGAPAGRPSHVVVIDRRTMTACVVDVPPIARAVIGIAVRADGDTVLLGVRSEGKKSPTVLAISAATGHQETVRLRTAR